MAHTNPFELPDRIKNYMTTCNNGMFLPSVVKASFLTGVLEMDIRSSDVLVLSWPKSGSTWLEYIVTLLIYGDRDVDKTRHLLDKHVFLEFPQNQPELGESEGMYKLAEDLPSPRLLKSHLKSCMLPKRLMNSKAKVIYIVRNPKDAAVSYFNFCRKKSHAPLYKDWSEFLEHFLNGLLPWGDWFEHFLPWWEKRNEPNVLFVKYEDMKKDLVNAVNRVSSFLQKPLSEKEIQDICEKSSFTAMKENPEVNPDSWMFNSIERSPIPFMRKGVIGDWKNYFTVAQNERFDKLYLQKMVDSGLRFDFE